MLTKLGSSASSATELLGDQRAERRVADRAGLLVAGPQVEGRPAVVAFLGAHRADDGDVFHLLGELGQVLADHDAGHRRLDRLELAAVGVAGLGVEGVGLARAAGHPEQDARLSPLRVRARVGGQGLDPAGGREADDAGRGQPQHLAAR